MNPRTSIIKILSLAVLVLVIGASSALAQKKTLTYAGWYGLYDFLDEFVAYVEVEFERQFPDVDWVRNDVPFEQALNQATISTLGGNAPDNVHLIGGWVASISGIGGLVPLNDYFTAEEWGQVPKSSLDAVTFDGKIMAMPWVPGPILMFYNRNLFKQAGLDPDKPAQTWPELKEQILAICKLPPVDGAKIYGIALRTQRNPNSAQWTIPIIYGHGGNLEENGQVKFNTQGTRAAYEWMQDIVQAGCSPEGFSIGETRNTMASQRAGFVFEGPWGRGLFSNLSGGKTTTAADGDIWVSQMPMDPSGKRRTIANSHELGISTQSKNKKMAAEFIRFITFDKGVVEKHFVSTKQLSTSSLELLTTGIMGADAYTQEFVKSLKWANANPIKHAKFYAIMNEVSPAIQKIIATKDQSTIERELIAADRKIKRLLSRR